MLKKGALIFLIFILPQFMYAQDVAKPEYKGTSSQRDSLSHLLNMKVDSLYNPILYATVLEWLGTRYRYGGRTKKGIDCSDFTSILYKSTYDIDLSGGAGDMFKKTTPIPKTQLKEGDMVFFKIRRRKISHVGVYLADNKFAHATTRGGVVISDLSEPYYMKYFFKGGTISSKKMAYETPKN
jgi:lipoprotein Spr